MALLVEHPRLRTGVALPHRLGPVLGLFMVLCGCGDNPSERSDAAWRDDTDTVGTWAGRGDEETEDSAISADEALERAASEHAGMTYDDLGSPYGCTDDCSGHEAGVEWAREKEIYDPSDCGGRSSSFVEGCGAYSEAVQKAAAEIEQDEY